ncbi:MAG: hypothetical protein HYY86_02295 [Candidatus Harrisonbacteria bacterium]|nr:hypothetical protein [Candidatus Harrisonbacteria bacterium]
MENPDPILSYLEKLSEKMEADIDEGIFQFFAKIPENLFKHRDVYCFRPKETALFNIYKVPGDYLNAILPLGKLDSAVWLSIARSETASENEKLFGIKTLNYRIEVTLFNLTKTAGDPADLQILRGEKMIVDAVAGETLKSVIQKGFLKERKEIFNERYSQTIYPPFIKKIRNLFRGNKKSRAEEIVSLIQETETAIRWFLDNPEINRFRSRTAINY